MKVWAGNARSARCTPPVMKPAATACDPITVDGEAVHRIATPMALPYPESKAERADDNEEEEHQPAMIGLQHNSKLSPGTDGADAPPA